MTPDHLLKGVDEATIRCLVRINGSEEGKRLKALLADLIHKFDIQNRTFSGEALYRSQGAAVVLQALHDSLEKARDRAK